MPIPNSFIDEAAMKPEGVPIEYVKPDFAKKPLGLEVEEITAEEFIEARETAAAKRNVGEANS